MFRGTKAFLLLVSIYCASAFWSACAQVCDSGLHGPFLSLLCSKWLFVYIEYVCVHYKFFYVVHLCVQMFLLYFP